MKYFKLTDTTNYGDIIHTLGRHAFEYVHGIDGWVRTAKLLRYLWDEDENYELYEEISEEEAHREIELRRECLGRMLGLAREIAGKAHGDQKDKAGRPYIDHPLRVAEDFLETEYRIVALLHDVCEDSDMTPHDLKEAGFSKRIVQAVTALTKQPDEEYNAYLRRVKENYIACAVKIADLKHNLEIDRLKDPTAEDYERLAKYKDAIEYLGDRQAND